MRWRGGHGRLGSGWRWERGAGMALDGAAGEPVDDGGGVGDWDSGATCGVGGSDAGAVLRVSTTFVC